MLGLIFPEKVVYSKNTFRTVEDNVILTLLCNVGAGTSTFKKRSNNKFVVTSYPVAPTGQFLNRLIEKFKELYILEAVIM